MRQLQGEGNGEFLIPSTFIPLFLAKSQLLFQLNTYLTIMGTGKTDHTPPLPHCCHPSIRRQWQEEGNSEFLINSPFYHFFLLHLNYFFQLSTFLFQIMGMTKTQLID
jgi:hypothetical protein